jgi:hypothetical protein
MHKFNIPHAALILMQQAPESIAANDGQLARPRVVVGG